MSYTIDKAIRDMEQLIDAINKAVLILKYDIKADEKVVYERDAKEIIEMLEKVVSDVC